MGEMLATHRCPLCGWVGTAEGDLPPCPDCGHGCVKYRVELA